MSYDKSDYLVNYIEYDLTETGFSCYASFRADGEYEAPSADSEGTDEREAVLDELTLEVNGYAVDFDDMMDRVKKLRDDAYKAFYGVDRES